MGLRRDNDREVSQDCRTSAPLRGMPTASVHAEASEAEKPFVYLAPRAGTVLMWESWLRHEVPTNAAKSERISISFNYA